MALRSAITRALGSRPVEGRLVSFPYAPFQPARVPSVLELRPLLQTLEREATPGANALVALLDGKTREAVESFERVVAAHPEDARLLSDLSVAYLADARRNSDPASLIKALESAERAVELAPWLPEALFNRALARGRLHLDRQARKGWAEYLEIDSGSAWSQEAARSSGRLLASNPVLRWDRWRQALDEVALAADQAAVERIVAVFPQPAREYAEETLFGSWAQAWRNDDRNSARRALVIAHAIGDALARRKGDLMTTTAVWAIDQALLGPASRVQLLAEGHEAYQDGLRLYGEGRFQQAESLFAAAEDHLRQADSPFADWARFRLAVCRMQGFQYDQALAMLRGVQSAATAAGFTALEGRSAWVCGLILGILAKPAESLAAYQSAARAFSSIFETENLGIVNSLTAEGLRNLGDLRAAWHHHFLALGALAEIRESTRRQLVLEQASESALRMEQPQAAILFLQEALMAEPSSLDSAVWFYCHWMRSLAHSRAGRTREAWNDLRQARKELARFPDAGIRNSLLGDLLAMEGRVLIPQNPADALTRLAKAIEIYEKTDLLHPLALLYGERARAHLALGRVKLAERDFAHAIEKIRRQRKGVQDEALRASYLDEVRSIFEDMVRLQVRLGQPSRALGYAESARAQALYERVAGTNPDRGSMLALGELQSQLPDQVALVEYSVLPDVLLAWVIQRDSLVLVKHPVGRNELDRLVRAFRSKILAGAIIAPQDPDSRRLFDLLFKRLQPELRGVKTLVIIPDRSLHVLPFAALRDPATGAYLIDQFALAFAPSASLYQRALGQGRELEGQSFAGALVLGDPLLDRGLLPRLPRLAEAAREAASIAALYPGASLLTGSRATRQAFLEGLGRFSVVHFAGHAVSNSADPSTSFLALASTSKAESGALYAHELYRMRLTHAPRLVVLSACSGLSGPIGAGEGISSLARPFLAMGVPAVVGSLWRANDRPARAVMEKFHQNLRSGLPAAEALRQAQVDLASSRDATLAQPVGWAGLQLQGFSDHSN